LPPALDAAGTEGHRFWVSAIVSGSVQAAFLTMSRLLEFAEIGANDLRLAAGASQSRMPKPAR
jgi:hypothetical protein